MAEKKIRTFYSFHPRGIFLVGDFEPQKNPIGKEWVSGCTAASERATDKKE
jgi:hypothetical protein